MERIIKPLLKKIKLHHSKQGYPLRVENQPNGSFKKAIDLLTFNKGIPPLRVENKPNGSFD